MIHDKPIRSILLKNSVLFLFLLLPAVQSILLAQEKSPPSKLLFVGHRGASFLAPENTLASMQLAWEMGADGAECDVMLTKDNRVILFHDEDAKRMTGEKLFIRETNWIDLKDLYVKSRFTNHEKYMYEKIPLLRDVLSSVPENRMLVIEIKTGNEILPFLKTVVDETWNSGSISFISFNYETIVALKKMYPVVLCYYLSSTKGDIKERFNDLKTSNLDGVDLRYRIISKKLVRKYNSAGLDVWCWTVNNPEDARKMRNDGVTAITTDRPQWLKNNM